MEVLAAIEGLEALKESCEVTLYSDSKYLVDAMNKGWALRWQANGWRHGRRRKVVNADLWERLLHVCARHDVGFQWVKGHAGNPENERCDALSVELIRIGPLGVDEVYEKQPEPEPPESQMQVPQVGEARSKKWVPVEGQPCRKCSMPLVKRTPRRKPRKPGQEYYFEFYLHCDHCRTMYMVDDAKRYYEPASQGQRSDDSMHESVHGQMG
jgi:ribonuclease HI